MPTARDDNRVIARSHPQGCTPLSFRHRTFLQLILCLAVWVCLLGSAISSRAETSAPEGILWRVRSDRTVGYLAGSIHFLKPGTPLPPAYLNAFRDCRTLIFETDIEEMESPEAGERMLSAGLLPPGESLDQHLRPATRSALHRYLEKRNLPAQFLQKLRPWMCGLTLAVYELQKIGFDPQQGLDRQFSRLGRQERKSMGGLETLDEQIGLFEGLTKDEEEEFLRQTLEDLQSLDTNFSAMIESWWTGDEAALAALIRENFAEFPGLYASLFTQRNRRWAEQIAGLLEGTDPVMVIVGAGHLVGEGNLVHLLRLRGFQVERLGGDEKVR